MPGRRRRQGQEQPAGATIERDRQHAGGPDQLGARARSTVKIHRHSLGGVEPVTAVEDRIGEIYIESRTRDGAENSGARRVEKPE